MFFLLPVKTADGGIREELPGQGQETRKLFALVLSFDVRLREDIGGDDIARLAKLGFLDDTVEVDLRGLLIRLALQFDGEHNVRFLVRKKRIDQAKLLESLEAVQALNHTELAELPKFRKLSQSVGCLDVSEDSKVGKDSEVLKTFKVNEVFETFESTEDVEPFEELLETGAFSKLLELLEVVERETKEGGEMAEVLELREKGGKDHGHLLDSLEKVREQDDLAMQAVMIASRNGPGLEFTASSMEGDGEGRRRRDGQPRLGAFDGELAVFLSLHQLVVEGLGFFFPLVSLASKEADAEFLLHRRVRRPRVVSFVEQEEKWFRDDGALCFCSLFFFYVLW